MHSDDSNRLNAKYEGKLFSAYNSKSFPAYDLVFSWVGPGWHPFLEDLLDDLFALGWDGRVAQVKEKFGTLRFYVGGTTDEQYAAIRAAEKKSAVICEECGAPGKLRSGSWLKTYCDEHAKEFGYEDEEEEL